MKPFHLEVDTILEHLLIRHSRPGVAVVWQVEMSHGTGLGKDHKTNDTTGAAVPLNRLLQRTPHEIDALFLRHLFPPVGIGIAIDVGRARAADSERLLVEGSSQRYRVHLTSVSRIPSGKNDARTIGQLARISSEDR